MIINTGFTSVIFYFERLYPVCACHIILWQLIFRSCRANVEWPPGKWVLVLVFWVWGFLFFLFLDNAELLGILHSVIHMQFSHRLTSLTTVICPGKCITRLFHCCTNITECTYTNLDDIVYYTSRLYVTAYCSKAVKLCSMLLRWILWQL